MEPVVVNGVAVVMTRGSEVRNSFFSASVPPTRTRVGPGGFQLVTMLTMLANQPFTASLVTAKLRGDGVPCPVVGATVTTPDGYSGTLGPQHGAGVKFNVA